MKQTLEGRHTHVLVWSGGGERRGVSGIGKSDLGETRNVFGDPPAILESTLIDCYNFVPRFPTDFMGCVLCARCLRTLARFGQLGQLGVGRGVCADAEIVPSC